MEKSIRRGAPLAGDARTSTGTPVEALTGRLVAMKRAPNYHDGVGRSEGAAMEQAAWAVTPAVVHIYSAQGIDWATHHVHVAAELDDGSLDLDRLYCCGSPQAVSLAVRQVAGRRWQCPGVYAGCDRPSTGTPVRIRIKGNRYIPADALRARR